MNKVYKLKLFSYWWAKEMPKIQKSCFKSAFWHWGWGKQPLRIRNALNVKLLAPCHKTRIKVCNAKGLNCVAYGRKSYKEPERLEGNIMHSSEFSKSTYWSGVDEILKNLSTSKANK